MVIFSCVWQSVSFVFSEDKCCFFTARFDMPESNHDSNVTEPVCVHRGIRAVVQFSLLWSKRVSQTQTLKLSYKEKQHYFCILIHFFIQIHTRTHTHKISCKSLQSSSAPDLRMCRSTARQIDQFVCNDSFKSRIQVRTFKARREDALTLTLTGNTTCNNDNSELMMEVEHHLSLHLCNISLIQTDDDSSCNCIVEFVFCGFYCNLIWLMHISLFALRECN